MLKTLSEPRRSQIVKDFTDIGSVILVESRRARRINITVKSSGEVRVAVPKRTSFRDAECFVKSKHEWIKRQLGKTAANQKMADEYLDKIKELNLDEAAVGITARLQELADEFGFRYNRLTIRNQKTRWGSCSTKNNLSLNIKLALLPDELRDLILVHELVHTRIKNHGPDFWRKLENIYPNARELDRRVNRLGGLLRLPLFP